MNIQIANWDKRNLNINLNVSRLSLTIEDSTATQVFNFDLEGRPWNIYLDGRIHQRGLDGKVVAKWGDPQSGRGRRWLSKAEADQLLQTASDLTASLLADIRSNKLRLEISQEADLIGILQKAAQYASNHSEQDIARFTEIYTPVGILPPDQYQAVLLQATEGCSFNSCTFCDFYKGRRFHVKSDQAFTSHAREVHDFLGAGLSLRRTVFLGDANALVIPTKRLLSMMSIASHYFDLDALGGFYAFLDGFSGERKSKRDYIELRNAGLERVYIGMESGHDPLLRFLNKPGSADDALHAVRKMKAGGVPVGVIILLGAGGKTFAEAHIEDTIKMVNKMKLGMHDQIYFSELVELENMPYARNAFRNEIKPLNQVEVTAQAEKITSKLNFNPRRGTPHISRYDIREFVY